MPRLPRFDLPGYPQHVIVRGNNRARIFHREDDYDFYLEKLKQACDRNGCDVHAYVLMTNHVHMLVTPQRKQTIGKALQMLGRYYVQYFNRSYQRTGTLWEGRYKATLVDSERYLLTCYRYIELNPIRAGGMAEHPSQYPWSSYPCNALGQADEVVVPHPEYLALGKDAEARQQAYRALFKNHIGEKKLQEIREATNKAWVLGSGQFKEQMERQVKRPVAPRKRGGDRKSADYRAKMEINRL